MTEENNSELKKKEGVYVIKMDGERELFDINKLRTSLGRAKAPREIVEKIVQEIESEIFDGMSTSEIYKRAYEILHKEQRPVAARYSLRRALAELGPTGFPFEYFVGELFRAKGFDVKTGIIVQGHCVEHEVDMVAENEHEQIFMEIKFHNDVKIKSDVKVSLYVKARFDDILKKKNDSVKKQSGWLLTNTKFTKNALEYAKCVGLNIISWSYPEVGNLHSLIEETGLYPLTCLSVLPKHEKNLLMSEGVVLSSEIKDNTELLQKHGLSEEVIKLVQDEAENVCVVNPPLTGEANTAEIIV